MGKKHKRTEAQKAASRTAYAAKLLDPRWRARRAHILKRDGYACRRCGVSAGLQVHHLRYAKNGNPWDVPDKALQTLCAACHMALHAMAPKTKQAAARERRRVAKVSRAYAKELGELTRSIAVKA